MKIRNMFQWLFFYVCEEAKAVNSKVCIMEKSEITCIIVDDEIEARLVLAGYLEQIPGINVLGITGQAAEVIDMVLEKQPDVLFLDIDMPIMNGIQIARAIRSLKIDCQLVFVTAYDAHGIEAVKLAALDYMLKPVSIDELKPIVHRLRQQKTEKNHMDRLDDFFRHLDKARVRFNTRNGFRIALVEDIIFCEADGNYCNVVMANSESFIVTNNLLQLEKQINSRDFVRISRTHLVNTQYLVEVDRKNKLCIFRKNGLSVELKASSKGLRSLDSQQLV